MNLVENIAKLARGKKNLRLMEVCGTHTVAIFRSGIRQLLPGNISLVSGPGCPVCVTNDDYIDRAIAYARENFIIATFGDMLKVPGSNFSLENAKSDGARVEIVYSPLDCIEIAEKNPESKVIFLAVGFETTAPTAAATVLAAKSRGIRNLFMFSAQKLVPPAIKFLLGDSQVKVDGFLLPGHVAVIIGAKSFNFLAETYKIPSAIGGFEAEEILIALKSILEQIDGEKPVEVANNYRSVVKFDGNVAAKRILSQVYEISDANWRGMGKIPASGLKMRDEFADFDVERVFPIKIATCAKKTACRCGEVLRGAINPTECPLFGKICTPLHAVGACMVSIEGVCAAWFKYGGAKFKF